MVNKITIRMYRLGTGDFFLLQFRNKTKITFNLVIDCGCIQGNKAEFTEKVTDLKGTVKGVIDLLIVTHEHADHINGFEKASGIFDSIEVKEVWFAWTEEDEEFANKFRRENTKVKAAIAAASGKLTALLQDGSFKKMYENERYGALMLEAKEFFISSLNELNLLNFDSGLSLKKIPTMEDLLKEFKVIKSSTKVRYFEPGNVIENIKGAEGIRFFVLGPPKDNDYIKMKEKKGEGYEKREKPSRVNLSFLNAFDESLHESENKLFEDDFVLNDEINIQKEYNGKENTWRNIDNDWLFSAGSLALRHQTSINNTSLVIAIQFIDSEKILLFPGDAEHGNWLSWHDGLEWSFKKDGKLKKVNAEYILNNTVFYKTAHHLSNNGTIKQKGLDLMKQDEFASMVTLDFKKINKGWMNTMPNDLIGAELIRKTKGKLFFAGDRAKILKNIKTDRVSVSKTNLDILDKMNKPFDGKFYIEYDVKG